MTPMRRSGRTVIRWTRGLAGTLVLAVCAAVGPVQAGNDGDLVGPAGPHGAGMGHASSPSSDLPSSLSEAAASPSSVGEASSRLDGPVAAAALGPVPPGPITPEEASRLAVRCGVPEDLRFTDAALPRLALRLKASVSGAPRVQTPVSVVVLGSGSSAGAGVSAPEHAYPARLRRELERVFPGQRFEVRTLARRGARVSDMLARIDADVVALKPSLLVWQIGATDAVNGIPINRFGRELQRGLARLEKADIDVLLMDMQFSPFTGLLINAREYRGYIRWIAKRAQVPLLRRYEMMEYWADQGVFELEVTDQATADGVHACVALQAADLIRTAVDEAGR